MTMQEAAKEVMMQPLVFGRLFERPKCKPWDIVRGRRFECCHGLGKHTAWCLVGVKTIIVPKFNKLSARDLTNA